MLSCDSSIWGEKRESLKPFATNSADKNKGVKFLTKRKYSQLPHCLSSSKWRATPKCSQSASPKTLISKVETNPRLKLEKWVAVKARKKVSTNDFHIFVTGEQSYKHAVTYSKVHFVIR